ncbi:MAG: hypothetical protein ACI9J2_000296 [Saprospiraceae bacterium]|jgi:hypothetical protein
MFSPIQIPFDSVMLFNVVDLKEGVTIEDVELTLGEMCNVVKNAYGDEQGGFLAGQVFKFSGFVSNEGSFTDSPGRKQGDLAIVTYWRSFEQHEKSHADKAFKEKFDELVEVCDDAYEVGYELLWQGEAEDQ